MVPPQLLLYDLEMLPDPEKNCNYEAITYSLCQGGVQSFRTVDVILSMSFKMRGDSKTVTFLIYTLKDYRLPELDLRS
jgi:hypothetical protein